MVRPKFFGFNAETESSNKFQKRPDGKSDDHIRFQAVREFDEMVRQLRDKGIEVRVYDDLEGAVLPDSIFPNNWITTHEDGSIYTYPMESPIRRKERREDIIHSLEKEYQVSRRYSLELFELQQQYLEGTGSLVLDRKNKLAYSCLSPRTDVRVLHKFSLLTGYEIIYFEAKDKNGYSIYHTNVLMAMGLDFVICCMDSIDSGKRDYLESVFEKTGKELVSISFEQMEHFAGNMLQVRAADGSPYLVMSQTAYHSLHPDQINRLKAKTKLIVVDIPTIESIGGGSARCMMAENFLSPRS